MDSSLLMHSLMHWSFIASWRDSDPDKWDPPLLLIVLKIITCEDDFPASVISAKTNPVDAYVLATMCIVFFLDALYYCTNVINFLLM